MSNPHLPLVSTVRLAVCALLLGALPAPAVETQIRIDRSSLDFAQGEMDHVSVSPAGRVVLSPDYKRLAELDEPVAWALAELGPDLLVATGHDGRVLRIPLLGGSPVTTWFDSTELEIHALASSPTGTVWVGSSPDGRVYKALPGGKPEPFFDPEERYIWAIQPVPDGSILVATGDKGAVYRVSPDGKATPALIAEETHVLSLALAPDGTLYAGSGGNGYIYKVETDGKTTVLLDTAGSEVKAVALDSEGNLWAVSTGRPTASTDSTPAFSEPSAQPITVTVTEDSSPTGMTGGQGTPGPTPVQQPQPAAVPTPTPAATIPVVTSLGSPGAPRQSWLYRLRASGLPEEIWRSSSETVHALALFGPDVVMGTGEEGKLFGVNRKTGEDSILLDLPGAQVTALCPSGTGLALATSNLASVWRVAPSPAAEGSFISTVIDAGHFATWGRLTVRGTGNLQVATRSGNTEKPGGRWSAWEDAPGQVRSPKGRYLQYRVKLSAPEGRARAELREVELAYLPHNLAPRLRQLSVLDPHVELISSAAPPSGLAAAPGRTLPPTRDRSRPAAGEGRAVPREQETYGARSARWEAEDPNGDALSFQVYYRGEEESDWKPLARDLSESFVAFDATALPDGVYLLRIEASDEPANPGDRSLSEQLVSEPFTIDNSPPRVELSEAVSPDGKARAGARISDRLSGLRWAEYSVDSGPWRPLLPVDEVFDASEETVEIPLPALAPGSHTLIVRAGDAARNVGSGKLVIKR